MLNYGGWTCITLVIIGTVFFLYVNRGLAHKITPAQFTHLSLDEGNFEPIDSFAPGHIYGIGLAYAGHINETASEFNPDQDPPVFQKAVRSYIRGASSAVIPSQTELVQAGEQLEPGLGQLLDESHNPLPALLDYEVELAFVLLEDVDTKQLLDGTYIPKIGFFVANDLSARSLAILGEGQPNRHAYWGISKSFKGFTPVSQQVWIPNEFHADAIPIIRLQTLVNEEIRQDQLTSDLIYTPLQMLQAIHRTYPNRPLQKGDWVLTGTPGGVILSTPRWLVRTANLLGLDRFKKLANKTSEKEADKFLKPGDIVVCQGKGLGTVTTVIMEK